MNIQEAIKEKTVIHCKTKSEAIRILAMASDLGYKWMDGEDYTCNDNWDIYKDQTYYHIFKGRYSKHAYVNDPSFTIINSTDITDMKKSTYWTPAPEDLLAMKQELTITPPSGYEIDEENSTFQKIVFREIESKFPTKLEEIDRPWYIDGHGIIADVKDRYAQTPNHFTSKKSAEQALKFIKLLAFRDAIWEIEGEPENTDINIIFRFKTPEGLAHFYKMKREIELGNL